MENAERSKDIKFAIETIKELITNKELPLFYGYARRRGIFKSKEKGSEVKNYRTEFIERAAEKVMTLLLSEIVPAFNAENPQDRVSVDDVRDILRLTSESLGKKKSSQ